MGQTYTESQTDRVDIHPGAHAGRHTDNIHIQTAGWQAGRQTDRLAAGRQKGSHTGRQDRQTGNPADRQKTCVRQAARQTSDRQAYSFPLTTDSVHRPPPTPYIHRLL